MFGSQSWWIVVWYPLLSVNPSDGAFGPSDLAALLRLLYHTVCLFAADCYYYYIS